MSVLTDRTWPTGGKNGKPLQYCCHKNPMNMNSMKKLKDMTPEDQTPRSEGVQYPTGEERKVKWKLFSHVRFFATPQTIQDYSPGQNTGVDSLSLLQGIFPTQGLNPGLLHFRWILYQLSHKGSPILCMCVSHSVLPPGAVGPPKIRLRAPGEGEENDSDNKIAPQYYKYERLLA